MNLIFAITTCLFTIYLHINSIRFSINLQRNGITCKREARNFRCKGHNYTQNTGPRLWPRAVAVAVALFLIFFYNIK